MAAEAGLMFVRYRCGRRHKKMVKTDAMILAVEMDVIRIQARFRFALADTGSE